MSTLFAAIYNRFLGKITDDMYMELTPDDTMHDLRQLLLDAIPNFEFPRNTINLNSYVIGTSTKPESEVQEGEFVIGIVWNEIAADNALDPKVLIEESYFDSDLTDEEMNILSILMMQIWTQRQVTSIENTRMKYSGTDFKMTSQANHLAKLLSLQDELRRQSTHAQRLYKRRRPTDEGGFESNWDVFGYGVYNTSGYNEK